jgi:hypothetical protein
MSYDSILKQIKIFKKEKKLRHVDDFQTNKPNLLNFDKFKDIINILDYKPKETNKEFVEMRQLPINKSSQMTFGKQEFQFNESISVIKSNLLDTEESKSTINYDYKSSDLDKEIFKKNINKILDSYDSTQVSKDSLSNILSSYKNKPDNIFSYQEYLINTINKKPQKQVKTMKDLVSLFKDKPSDSSNILSYVSKIKGKNKIANTNLIENSEKDILSNINISNIRYFKSN